MGQNSAGKRRYITGFDGLRAIAVIGVIVFHLWPNRLTGGWLGVPLFFVLSGYLITDLLIQEYDRNGRIDLIGFYRRRIKRLYPALVVMLFATATMIGLFARDLLYNLRAIISSNMLYIYNIWATKHGESYFDSWGGASPFTHLWSLSIEGQFYFIWPIIVLIVLALRIKRTKVSIAILVVATLSAIWMGVMYDPANINRAYYGTDTRIFAVLFGTALAFTWPSNRMKMTLSPRVKRNLDMLGIGSLVLTIIGFFWLNGQWSATYMGLMFVFTAVIAGLIAITSHPASFLSHALDNKVLNYLGTRSYSIYLYQLPVFVFFDKFTHHNDSFIVNLLKIAVVLGIAELSYRYVENVFRRFKKPAMQPGVTLKARFFASRQAKIMATVAAVFLLGTVNAVAAKQSAKPRPETQLQKRLHANASEISAKNKRALEAAKASNAKKKSAKKSSVAAKPVDPTLLSKYGLTKDQLGKISGNAVTAVGDSVMVDVAPDLQELMPNTVADAAVGRQAYSVPGILQSYAGRGVLAPNVIISIGTNGTIGEDVFKQIMNTVGDRQVYWVNGYADRSWIATNNQFLTSQASQYPNLHIVDWYDAVKDHADWLGDDHVHPNPNGSVQYAAEIAKAMANSKK
ncbi:acyltransferase family protein [Weissella cibaria]|uniref:acyltransferase family protein n=1 Tax=Weissella cibaria TaxID=137591 RepID=UPI001370902C|nr:acyltransferase family protein [Weissella cibaria]MYV36573.1 acyltransferase family protein [Weissella cibaria]